MHLEPGHSLGDYTILRRIAAGAMSEVFEAKDRVGRTVAIKVPFDDAGKVRLEREARVLGTLRHENILTMYDYRTSGEITYLVLEHLEGNNLRTLLARGPLVPEDVLTYGLAALRGLLYVHKMGIVHHDLKPENLFVTAESQVKLLDFGVARTITRTTDTTPGSSQTDATTVFLVHSDAGEVAGTRSYMAPEQRVGEVDARSDIFTFGIILYEMLTSDSSVLRHSGSDTGAAIRKAIREDSSIPRALARLILKCISQEKDLRYQSVPEVISKLESIQAPSYAGRIAWITLGIVGALAVLVFFSRNGGEILAVCPFEDEEPTHLAMELSKRTVEKLRTKTIHTDLLQLLPSDAKECISATSGAPVTGATPRATVILYGRVRRGSEGVEVHGGLLYLVGMQQFHCLGSPVATSTQSDPSDILDELSELVARKTKSCLEGAVGR